MKENPETSADQVVYRDIVRGYSEVSFKKDILYVKHISNLDFGTLQEYEKERYEEAKSKGLFTKKQKIKSLIEEDLWDKKREEKLKDLKTEVENLKITIRKLILAKQKRVARENIEKIEKEFTALNQERDNLVGVTCEKYAQSKSNQEFLRTSIFKSKDLQELKYPGEEFYELSDEDVTEISDLYNEALAKFSSLEVKKIAASGFFLNGLIASQSNANFFYGKPIIGLSNYQLDLFSTGIRY